MMHFTNLHDRPRIKFIMVPPEDREGWSVIFDFPGDEPVFFVENCTHFSSIAQMTAKGLRMFEHHPDYDLEVVDPSGHWEHWMTHTQHGHANIRLNIPEHFA